MATKTWLGGHTGDPNSWSDTANWTGGLPVAGDAVVISLVANQPTLDVTTASLRSVTINAGATLAVGAFALNVTFNGGTGINLAGSGSTLTVAGGSINDTNSNVVLATGSLLSGFGTVNAHNGYTGSGTITASGGTLSVTGTVNSGVTMTVDAGTPSDLDLFGTATASSAIAITNNNQTLGIGPAGNLTITPAESITAGTIEIDGNLARLTDVAGISLGAGSTLIGSGIVASGANGSGGTGLLSGTGVVEANGGTLDLTKNIGTTGLNFEISGNATSVLQLDGSVATGNTFTFLGAAGDLALSNNAANTFNDTIVGFNVGSNATPSNFMDILNVPTTVTLGAAGSGATGTVHLSDGATLNLSGISNPLATWFVNTTKDSAGTGTDIFLSALCFAAGTRILTATGERTVESLMQGDIVLTLAGGDLNAEPVKWIGRRRIDLAAHPRPETVAPIRIRRGAFADNMPRSDLLLSPDHAIFVEGKLVCARQLINGTTIRQEKGWPSVEYFHVELDEHAILLAEGLPAESYLNTGNRGFFANADEPLLLHPDLTDETDYLAREAGSCVPFVSDEASVLPVWQRLVERAAAMSQPVPRLDTTGDPELRIIAKGRALLPLYGENKLYIFALPKGATEMRLVSRASAPTDVRPWLEDRRRLGVYVERIVVRDASNLQEVPVDHPGLSRGWWAVEKNGIALRRWTDGDAVLPLPALSGPAMLEVRLGGEMTYAISAKVESGRKAA
jgi:hypothetical protein